MASDYSALGDIQRLPEAAIQSEASLLGGKVRVAFCHFETTALAAASTVYLAKLPKGARLLPISHIMWEAGQDAGLTVDMGDDDDAGEGAAVDPNRYMLTVTPGANDAITYLSAAANVDAAAWEGGPADANSGLTCYKLGSESWITLTTAAKTLVADKFIIVWLFYVVD